MKLEIKQVTEEKEAEILRLQVGEDQKGFIETPEECLEEARVWTEFRPVGLYSAGRPVGFAMYGWLGDGKGGGNLWIDRLLIDQRFQRQGYGLHFMEMLMERVLEEYGEQPIYLSVYPDNEAAIRLYRKLGFVLLDEYDTKGEQVMRKG
ncbi:GNAT family N-acetyltransferase [Edaphobacillus lindanitolerans]|uniref:Diamine N-acetyltransferase n=1 Tax=Edaphobacillus lindanitolerans TaxID=550447 RepID=A0A1U7PSD5_9BACI|nr:GNAT family N-acetyltransferase [Edaphobacillus lindanitolerans]SIT89119.1 diamine N-acetyltransferase [Edaphobacillus lindanitolerans]